MSDDCVVFIVKSQVFALVDFFMCSWFLEWTNFIFCLVRKMDFSSFSQYILGDIFVCYYSNQIGKKRKMLTWELRRLSKIKFWGKMKTIRISKNFADIPWFRPKWVKRFRLPTVQGLFQKFENLPQVKSSDLRNKIACVAP